LPARLSPKRATGSADAPSEVPPRPPETIPPSPSPDIGDKKDRPFRSGAAAWIVCLLRPFRPPGVRGNRGTWPFVEVQPQPRSILSEPVGAHVREDFRSMHRPEMRGFRVNTSKFPAQGKVSSGKIRHSHFRESREVDRPFLKRSNRPPRRILNSHCASNLMLLRGNDSPLESRQTDRPLGSIRPRAKVHPAKSAVLIPANSDRWTDLFWRPVARKKV
jgi:hypothetical protein